MWKTSSGGAMHTRRAVGVRPACQRVRATWRGLDARVRRRGEAGGVGGEIVADAYDDTPAAAGGDPSTRPRLVPAPALPAWL